MRNKNLLILSFILLIISITIGYAYLETDLNINSNVHIKKVVPVINYYEGNTIVNNIPNNKTYDFDTTKSNCTSGQLSWDEENWKPIIKSNKKTTCNLYFNEIKYCSSDTCNFDYTGTYQVFTAPKDGTYKIELWGSEGGYAYDAVAGKGAYVKAKINLKKNLKLYFYVGGTGNPTSYNNHVNGGYNGGGGSTGQYSKDDYSYDVRKWGAGGGATDIRLIKGKWNNFEALKSRIMVAGAGGGAYASLDTTNYYSLDGGSAGGLKGYDSEKITSETILYWGHGGFGATQTRGGYDEQDSQRGIGIYALGKFGQGGQKTIGFSTGGGSGYFGGGGSSHVQGAGGGSSYISGHNGCVAITEDSTEDKIVQKKDSNGNTCTDGTTDITCSYHYSGYIFTDTVMIDGAGYNWTTEKGQYIGQPQPDGTTATGHSGNGYARITYISS